MGLGAQSFKALAQSCALGAVIAGAAPEQGQAQSELLPTLLVTASRLGVTGITGTSTTVITAEEIARTPAESLQDILAREPGVQTWSTFGGVGGARTVVDMRGFGAAAPSNTLILVNGRRLTDVDLAGVDFAAIPRDSIERIEITRGNSGAVLYGDNAVGGVINIVTKTNVKQPAGARIEAGFGSFKQREGNGSVHGSSGPFTMSLYGNVLNSDGYRVNNELRQRNGVADLRYTGSEGTAFVTFTADDQQLGLPGARRVQPPNINQLASDRRGATTPYDYADKQGQTLTAGVTRNFGNTTEVIIDGGVRVKHQQAAALLAFAENYLDARLTTSSITPRVINQHQIFAMPGKVIAGFDFYDADFHQDRGMLVSTSPVHRYDLNQRTMAGYVQETLSVLPSTDVAFGMRVEKMQLTARDRFDPNAPGAFPPFDLEGLPHDRTETNRATHFGVEHRLNETFTLFGRMARAFRTPNVDERVAMVPSFSGIPTRFDLKTQTSRDQEAGLRVKAGKLDAQWSIYDMKLENEIHFSPATFTNTNLDPTRRRGHETIVGLQLTDAVRVKGGIARTHATFREGPFAGNDVPLVSKWTGSAGVAWDIWQKYLTLDVTLRHVGTRRMDNDQVNLQPLIPAFNVIDLRVGGERDQFFWSFAVLNLADLKYFDYAIASPFPFGFGSALGVYNAYPQPGRSFMVKAGMKW